MAFSPHEKMDACSQRIIDGSQEFSLRCNSCARLLKPEAAAMTDSYCIDVLPVLDESSMQVTVTCPYGSFEDEDSCSILGLSERGITNPPFSSELSLLKFLEASCPSESQLCLDVHQNCENYIDLKIESAHNSSSQRDTEFTEKSLEAPKIADDNFKPMRADSVPNAALLKKSSMQVGGKIMQFLVDCSLMLLKYTSRVTKTAMNLHSSTDKCMNERGLESTNNKFQRYKRSTSFNSRKIVLFSSILSSMGTMVLIYLTLRVKQISDGLVRV